MIVIDTPRLRLRSWLPSDREPFALLNADPRVMEFYPSVLSRSESDALVDRVETHFERFGFGPFAVELPGNGNFIGYTGPFHVSFEASFTPAVEVGWRLARDHWGHGYATEAARAALHYCGETLRLKEVVAFAVPANIRSRRVMEKVGMIHDPGADFDHPDLPDGHPLRRHVLYRYGC